MIQESELIFFWGGKKNLILCGNPAGRQDLLSI